jgi:predicted P-loop ATPase/GTPase
MESAKTPTCGVYSDFLLHQAGIGNDLRMMLRELNELNIQIKYLSNGKPKMLKAINFLGVLLFGPKKVKDIDFCYSPHVLPRIYNVPHIVRIHDIFPLTNPYWFKLTSRIYFKLSMMTHKRSFFLFDSESTKQDFQKYF